MEITVHCIAVYCAVHCTVYCNALFTAQDFRLISTNRAKGQPRYYCTTLDYIAKKCTVKCTFCVQHCTALHCTVLLKVDSYAPTGQRQKPR